MPQDSLLVDSPHPSQLILPTYGLRPKLPVGGHLSHFLPYWETLTNDPWVLGVIAHGYALEFEHQPPRFNAVLQTLLRSSTGSVLLEEVGGRL